MNRLEPFSTRQLYTEIKKRKAAKKNESISLKRKDVEYALQTMGGLNLDDLQKAKGGSDLVDALLIRLGYSKG